MLKEMGFNQWLQDQVDSDRLMAGQVVRVTAVNREMYTVSDGRKDLPAEITGRLMFSADSALDYPAVGDWVYVRFYNDADNAIIDEVLPRKSVLKRKTSGKKIDYQLIAANIDIGLIVQSLDANFNLRRLERYLVMIHDARIEPAVLLSKSDLLSAAQVEEKIRKCASAPAPAGSRWSTAGHSYRR